MKTPEIINAAIEKGAVVSVSISGGKDSQAMLSFTEELPRRQIVHADLGRAEWPQTSQFVEELAESSGLNLSVVRRTKGDLLDRIKERLKSVSTVDPTRPAKPFWPSAQQRYCTSDMKRDPILKQQRSLGSNGIIVSCVGFRAEESDARRKRPVISIEKRITSKRYRTMEPMEAVEAFDGEGRIVLTWLPIQSWLVGRVWEEIGTTSSDVSRRQELYRLGEAEKALDGFPGHPAYVFGNERLSCALCVLASFNDLCNGAIHNPELYAAYVELEESSTYTFRDGFSLKELQS